MTNIQKIDEKGLGMPIAEAARNVQVGREMLNAARAELRAIDKLSEMNAMGELNQMRLEKLERAQQLAEDVLDAEVLLGQQIAELPEAPGKRTDLEPVRSGAERLTKREAIASIGLSEDQARRYELLAKNPEIVAQIKISSREAGEIVSRTAVLHAISAARKPFIVNNSRDGEWYTPKKYIDSARAVMGDIDLDPASSDEADQIVQAKEYYTIEENGLLQPWYGRIWLNPPYNLVQRFVSKLLESEIEQAIILVNNGTETVWCKDLAARASACVFHTGRLRFVKPGSDSTSAPMQGQVFFYIGEYPDMFLEEFRQYGWGTKLNL